jgi:hypothetical protein
MYVDTITQQPNDKKSAELCGGGVVHPSKTNSGGMNNQQNGSSATDCNEDLSLGKRRRDEDLASGGRCHRGLGRGNGWARGSGSDRGIVSVGGERHSGAGRAHGRGSIEDSASGGRPYCGLGRGSGRIRESGSGRGIASVGGEGHHGTGRAHGRGSIRQRPYVPDVKIGTHHNNPTAAPVKKLESVASIEPSFIANDPESTAAAATNQHNSLICNIVTILPWPNPQSHYIPVEEEERLLPVLIHWGRSERGMMKDQPPFRLQKIQNMLDTCPGKGNHSHHSQNRNKNSSNRPSSAARMSLVQSLSLRRHHLKLLNPNLSMSTLRLGREEDIRDAAREFELCVDAYLRSHRVHFLTEHAQKSMFLESVKRDLATDRNVMQPPSPDFMMKKGHSVTLSFSSGCQNGTEVSCPISINWIEVKMFYGANSIPSGTPNAVGCILPKVQQYVSLYGTGAIVFMYGCGSRLAKQLLDVGVIALDGRCLDLERVENHQKKWCADSWGNILF